MASWTPELLADRRARCTCGRTAPSSPDLPFFEYRGAGSASATETCECGYSRRAHEQEQQFGANGRTITVHNVVVEGMCPGFRPRGGWELDTFYCGHSGWD